eukprot:jgi/Botrbrau1/14895/Bobra.0248s0012.1
MHRVRQLCRRVGRDPRVRGDPSSCQHPGTMGPKNNLARTCLSMTGVKGYGQSAFPVQSRQVVNRRSYSSYSPYDCLLSATHNCRTRLASGDAQHLSQPVPLHHYLVHKHRSSNH